MCYRGQCPGESRPAARDNDKGSRHYTAERPSPVHCSPRDLPPHLELARKDSTSPSVPPVRETIAVVSQAAALRLAYNSGDSAVGGVLELIVDGRRLWGLPYALGQDYNDQVLARVDQPGRAEPAVPTEGTAPRPLGDH